jgi:hypothetical protein
MADNRPRETSGLHPDVLATLAVMARIWDSQAARAGGDDPVDERALP